MLHTYVLTFVAALALSVSPVKGAILFKWYEDYACTKPVNGACIAGAGECCIPPYPPGINSVYISATDGESYLGWTMFATAGCHNPPVLALEHSGGPIPGSGCYYASNAAVGSLMNGHPV